MLPALKLETVVQTAFVSTDDLPQENIFLNIASSERDIVWRYVVCIRYVIIRPL